MPRPSQRKIRTRAAPACHACGQRGVPLYHGLRDRLFGAPGEWSITRCHDRECGLLWLDPAPLEDDLPLAYEDYYTHREAPTGRDSRARRWYRKVVAGYHAVRFGYTDPQPAVLHRTLGRVLPLHPGRRADADFAVMYLPALPGGRLMDVGAGNGAFLRRMADLGWQVEGVDTDPAAVERSRDLGLEIHPGTLASRRHPDGRFDAITMSHLIEHVHDPAGLLRECHRILRPGGRLVVVTPNGESWGHRRFGPNWRGLEPPRHIHVFTPRALRRLVASAGFGNVDTATTIRDANGMLLASRDLRRRGAHRMETKPSARARAWGRWMQWAEWLLTKARPEAGEEIALVAMKDTT